MEYCIYSKFKFGMYFQLTESGYFQILWKRDGQWRILKKWKTNIDPVKHCNVYKKFSCSHVDGPLCNYTSCKIRLLPDDKLKKRLLTDSRLKKLKKIKRI